MTRPRDLPEQPRRKKLGATNEPIKASPKATKLTQKSRKAARSDFLLSVARQANEKLSGWFTLGTMTYKAERARHPHAGKALVQVVGNTVELVDLEPQAVKDAAGDEVLVYWARRRGQVQKVLVHVPYVLAIVTQEHTAGGAPSAREVGVPARASDEGTAAGPCDPAGIMREARE